MLYSDRRVESGRTSTTSQYSGEEEIRASQCNTGKLIMGF